MIAAALRPEFDADAHVYRLGGKRLISVTQAIRAAGLVDDRWFGEQHATRGNYVHAALDYLDGGDLAPESVDDRLQGYVVAYQKFLHECDAGPIHWREIALCDPVRGYAGTVDRVREVGRQLSVVDIKTGPPSPWHALQLAAYESLARAALGATLPLRRWGLYLSADGTYTCRPYTDRDDWPIFCACLTVAQFKQRTGANSR